MTGQQTKQPPQIPEEYLVRKEKDIVEKQGIYVHTPSPFAKENLFYVQLEAFYTCGSLYEVRRTGLGAYLLFYIRDGKMLFEYEGTKFIAQSGDVVLLDCMRPHYYHAQVWTQFYWIHFNGRAVKAYFDHFLTNRGIHFESRRETEEHFALIHNMMRSVSHDEGMLSVQIHQILALLFSSAGPGNMQSDAISRARQYIDEHYMEKLSIKEIAAVSLLSESHFFRIFREETGLTPYGYLMNVRMNHAIEMLLETSRTVEEIAESCAFCSSANFIRSFRESTGVTPLRFRKLITGNGNRAAE